MRTSLSLRSEDVAISGARWIWCDSDTARLNQYALFRQAFDLPAGHGRVTVEACADMRYWLYVNGRRVGFGPGRFNPRFPQYDAHDITELVRPGANLVAFKVHSIGPVPAITSFIATRAALIAAVKWEGGCLLTDSGWRAVRETAYAGNTPRFSAHQSFIECFDARAAQRGWEQAGFDDSGWPQAFELPPDTLAPWEKLVPRPIPNLTLIPRTPARVVETGRSVPGAAFDVGNMTTLATAMETAARQPAELVKQTLARLFPLAFRAPDGGSDAAYAVLDFAENSAGYLTFHLEGAPGTMVDFGYGESFDKGFVECNAQTIRFVDRVILGDRPLEHQLMFPKCLRYLLVEVRGGAAKLLGVRQDVSTYPVEWRGAFACPDEPSLPRVWQVGAHTVQICMEDIYMDTPRRERSGWLGDMVPEALAVYYAFGETALARHSIELFMSSQQPEGNISTRYPGRALVNHQTYSASFTPALADYVRYSGDVSFVGQVWPGVRRLTEWFERQRTPDDLLVVTLPKNVFVDWAPVMHYGAMTTMNAFYYHYLREAAWLAEVIADRSEADRCAELADRTRRAIQQLLFDETRGIYVNCRDERGLSRQAGTQDNVLALVWDIATPEQQQRILSVLLPDDSAFPLYNNPDPNNWAAMSTGAITWPHDSLVPMGSPFMMFFALGALFEIGRATAALNNIRKHYGGLLSQGETSFWEEWSGVSSHSHGWAASPTAFLGKYVLGVAPVEPGFKTFSVLPATADLHRCRGRIPTPHGAIEVAWEKKSLGMTMRLDVPQGTIAKAGLPAGARSKLLVNGISCPEEMIVLRRGGYAACTLPPGRHELQMVEG